MLDVGLNLCHVAVAMFLQPQPVLAHVVFGAHPAAFLGIALAVSGAGLYFLRTFRPHLVRDQDIALAAVILLAGFILFFQGWRLDPILTFGCFLLAACAAAFALEALRLRGATVEQAKRSSPVIDDERPVSRVYRAELDDLAAQDERPTSRRIRGSRDYRSGSDADDYGESRRNRPSIRAASDRSNSSASRSKRRSSAADNRSYRAERVDAWDDDYSSSSRSAWDDDDSNSSRNSDWDDEPRRSATDESRSSRSSDSRSRRSRSSQDDYSRRAPEDGESSANYVDYQPINYSDDEFDNSSSFDR